MDRLNQLRSEASGSADSSLDTSSSPSEAYLTANDNSKYFSLLEDESSFNISKDAVIPEQEVSVTDSPIISNLSPIPKKNDLDSYKIGEQIEAANILSGGVNIFDDNENSYDGDELVIDDNAIADEKPTSESKLIDDNEYQKVDDNLGATVEDADSVIPSKDTEVVLQIDGKNVDAIDIGNGLYLYRKDGEEELAAVQIIDNDQQQSSFKFLKVRENSEGNLEVYEEIEIEVPKETPIKEVKPTENVPQITMQDVDNNINEPNKIDKKISTPQKDAPSSETRTIELSKELQPESKTEVNLNGKMIKFSESRKSPVIGSFTPMTLHSTPNKEGIPLTKTMVDQHLHPSRCSDNTKKTIEVHTDSSKQKGLDTPSKHYKEVLETKVEVAEKECKQPSLELDNKQNQSENKESFVQENIEVKNTNCQEIEDEVESSAKDNNLSNISDTITEGEVILKETEKNPLPEVNSHNKHSDTINLPVSNYELKTGVIENKDTLESSKAIDNIVNLEESIPNDVISSKVDLNEEKLVQEVENSQGIIVSAKEAQISSSYLEDNKNKNIEPNPNESEAAKNVILNNSNEVLSTIDNKKNTCEPKTETTNNEPSEFVNDKIISDQQIKLQSASNNEINVNMPQNNSEPKIVMKTLDRESNLEGNMKSKNVENVTPAVDELKTSLEQNELIKNHDKNQDNSKVESLKESTKDINIECKVTANRNLENEKVDQSLVKNKNQTGVKDETEKALSKLSTDTNIKNTTVKPVNNNNTAVPFGKWTEANRQEFLNKIKEAKVPSNTSNTKQIKQPKDLNRRDILQKIDSQRQQLSNNAISKVQEQQKPNTKVEPSAFVKSSVKHDTKIPVKERPASKSKPICNKKSANDAPKNHQTEMSNVTIPNVKKKESLQRREINNQDLIDKTVEDIINRVPPVVKATKEVRKEKVQNTEGIEKQKGMTLFGPSYHAKNEHSVTLDEIEMKMNELHGIPFVERPAHELPQKFIVDALHLKTETLKNTTSQSKVSLPSQLSITKTSQQQTTSEEVVNIDSDEEIIEHEPITGDVNPKKKSLEVVEKALTLGISQRQISEPRKKDVIITEKDFDKFFRRNSVTYENCLTVNFDGKEPHNVVQTVVEKDVAPKKLTRNEVLLAESKAKSTHKLQMLQARHNNNPSKIPTSAKHQLSEEEICGKNYQSKLQIAYQSALTAKRQKESPITIIEEKPVKVVFMDSNVDFMPCQLNVQGEKLSPVKHFTSDLETFTHSTTDSLDSDILDNYDSKSHDEAKTKTKHQRKQVLTPVETADMELIEPNDLGIDISPKKKRKIEEKPEKSPRNHVPKKSYLLGRTNNTDDKIKAQDADKVSFKEITNHNSFVGHSNPISAIDNLVKAAELLENQAESNSISTKTFDADTQQNTPVKRGRGRPRKYPLPDAEADKTKVPSPQKKPRLIDAKVVKREETDEDDTSDGEIIKENWTMGPSPNRSESDKRRLRESLDSDQSILDLEESAVKKKRKSKESVSKSSTHSDEVVVIEDISLSEKPTKQHISRKSLAKPKFFDKQNLVCEICGKTFRQSSYLAHHKLQHKNDELKKNENETNDKKSIFSCEVCKKEFRKLHHLVQHRIIHNPNPVPPRTLRKSSLEQGDSKVLKEQSGVKQNEDQSAGFRCEPCDKSFRKLHHLVEHRETHDGINRQKATEVETVKPAPVHQCDICDKTFKKLQLLNEHKDQHLETCSEKSDDKSVKSCLSTKDIIHECSLCYMVFPNEHSLNKHTVICLRKKKQSAAKAKQAALKKESEGDEVNSEPLKSEESDPNDINDSLIIIENNEIQDLTTTAKEIELGNDKPVEELNKLEPKITITSTDDTQIEQKEVNIVESIKQEPVKLTTTPEENMPVKVMPEISINKEIATSAQTQAKTKQREEQITQKIDNKQIHKKRTPAKDKLAATVTKRKKTVNVPLTVTKEIKLSAESSDDEEIRYMLNPDFKEEKDEEVEGKNFLKVKAKKRNSLQIERPSSKDLEKRRISLQHPPKISRLKNKLLEQKPVPTTSQKPTIAKIEKQVAAKPMDFTDSEDSETKYAFPETIKQNTVSASKVEKKPEKRKSHGVKRKSLSGIAKRKSLGKAINSKHKPSPKQTKPVKKRTKEVEHRCDCGKLFSSAALLSRHTTLDHTPPRIRRRRSSPPVADVKSVTKVDSRPATKTARRSAVAAKPKQKERESVAAGKSGMSTRKSSMNNSAAHRGVPVPEKMRKLMEKSKM